MKKPALSEHVCGDRVLCRTGKKKKRGIKDQGLLHRWAEKCP